MGTILLFVAVLTRAGIGHKNRVDSHFDSHPDGFLLEAKSAHKKTPPKDGVFKRRARDSNPQPVTRHFISNALLTGSLPEVRLFAAFLWGRPAAGQHFGLRLTPILTPTPQGLAQLVQLQVNVIPQRCLHCPVPHHRPKQ